MLVLSRQRDESIRIGDDITVTVVDIRGDKVRLGIDAPKLLAVHRQEVWMKIQNDSKVSLPDGGDEEEQMAVPVATRDTVDANIPAAVAKMEANDHDLLLAAIMAGKVSPSGYTANESNLHGYWLHAPLPGGKVAMHRVELDSFGCPILTPELRAALTEAMK